MFDSCVLVAADILLISVQKVYDPLVRCGWGLASSPDTLASIEGIETPPLTSGMEAEASPPKEDAAMSIDDESMEVFTSGTYSKTSGNKIKQNWVFIHQSQLAIGISCL